MSEPRGCSQCGKPLVGMHANARYCSERCDNRAEAARAKARKMTRASDAQAAAWLEEQERRLAEHQIRRDDAVLLDARADMATRCRMNGVMVIKGVFYSYDAMNGTVRRRFSRPRSRVQYGTPRYAEDKAVYRDPICRSFGQTARDDEVMSPMEVEA